MARFWLAVIAAAISFGTVQAHPGESLKAKRAEAKARSDYLASLENTDLAHCAGSLTSRGVVERTIERRRAIFDGVRAQDSDAAGLQKRQKFNFDTVLATKHKSKQNLGASYPNADWALLGQNKSTVLHPETTEGPYYIEGEFIRKNVIENEKGVKVHLDIQLIDIKSCKPIPNVALEIWGANALGIYSGVFDFMRGFNQDASVMNNKALRGIQISDKDGAVQFDTILPGHYSGRTNHIHVLSHINHTVLPNNTIQGGTVAHVGQIYFDQDLLDEVTKVAPYDKNTNMRMMNKNDFIMAFASYGGFDPVLEYVLLGNKVEDGIFAWMNFGIDSTNNRTIRAAGTCYESGCVANTKGFGDLLGPITDLLGKAVTTLSDLFKDPSKLGELFKDPTKIGDLVTSFSKGFPGGKGGPPGMPGMPGLMAPGMPMPTELPKGLEMNFGGFPFPFPFPIGKTTTSEAKATAAPKVLT